MTAVSAAAPASTTSPAIAITGSPFIVQENIRGYEFGTFAIVNPEPNETYTFVSNDPRFEVANGKFKLKDDAWLQYNAADSFVEVEVLATGLQSGTQLRQAISVEVLIGPPPWQNKNWALDVDDDGNVTALDALIIINVINQLGVGSLETPPPDGSTHFVDVNGDRSLTPLDVLIIINFLNQRPSNSGGAPSGEGEGPTLVDSSIPNPVQGVATPTTECIDGVSKRRGQYA